MDSRSVSAQLGLEKLPGRVGKLAAGMIYGVACDQQAVRLPLVAGALLASVQAGKRCALLSQADPGMFLRKARLAGLALEPHVRTGLLTIFHLDGEAAKHLFRSGIEGFLAELEQNFPGKGAFLALDQADPLFMLSDPRASAEAALRHMEWAAAHDHAVLAMFAPAAAAPRDYLTLKQVAENFGGFAIARATEGGALLEVRHWFGAEGASPRESFILRCNASGTLGIHPGAYPDEELPPVDSVISVREAVGGETPLWRSGQEVDSIAEAVDAARRSEAATLLLPFQKQADYELLCRAIVTVRAMARPSLRIVVRERGLRLRASQTLALMRLGVSSIVPADLSDSAAKRMVDSLHGTRFARPYEMDAQQVDAETSALTRRAVTSAGSFCDAVERLLAAADDFEIESCLVRLDFTAAGASAVVKIARRLGRDLVAYAHGDSAWLYVFGCPKSKVPTMLERLFKAPLNAMRASCATEHDPNRILAQLTQLREDCPTPR